jgi:hypothetical protein
MITVSMYWRMFQIGLLIGLLIIAGWQGYQRGAKDVQGEWDKEKVAYSAEVIKAQKKLRDIEAQLVRETTTIRKQTDEKVHSLIAQRDALLRRLRLAELAQASGGKLPELSCPAPAAALDQVAPGAGATELPRPLGEQDVDEALRADTLRLHLLACYVQYERAEDALKAVGARR